MKSITVEELKKKLSDSNRDELLIDVREPDEFRRVRIADAENIPLGHIENVAQNLADIGTVYVHCARGNRSKHACRVLESAGVNVVNVEGGITAWENAGFNLEKTGKQVIPIMRQVMIVAGALVLLGSALGLFINPWWLMLSAFVGAGLLFAGVSGVCTLSYILERMPWNR